MSIWQKISSWWSRDAVEAEAEAARDDSPAERDLAREDFEGRVDDAAARSHVLGGGADFERDSEGPSHPAE